jgi:hypothetical protein
VPFGDSGNGLELVARRSYDKLVALLAARDVARAEDSRSKDVIFVSAMLIKEPARGRDHQQSVAAFILKGDHHAFVI